MMSSVSAVLNIFVVIEQIKGNTVALARLNCLKSWKKNVILEPTYKLQDTLTRSETDITLSLQTKGSLSQNI